ncbi:MAG: hypothetical protein AAF436_19675, partial [Myxococcota bacterium]
MPLIRPATALFFAAMLVAVSFCPRPAAAQDPASEGAAPEEPTAEHPEAANRDEGDEVEVETAPAVTEVTEAVITLPGGVPLEP